MESAYIITFENLFKDIVNQCNELLEHIYLGDLNDPNFHGPQKIKIKDSISHDEYILKQNKLDTLDTLIYAFCEYLKCILEESEMDHIENIMKEYPEDIGTICMCGLNFI